MDALSYCVNRGVISFSDTESAWAYLKEHGADVVISNVDMPGMDGLDLMKKFKTDWENSIFILMSGCRDNMDLAETAGADAFLAKPFTIKDLFDIVQQFVVD